jgi:hypothetical protein
MVLETEFQQNMSVEFETNWIFDKPTRGGGDIGSGIIKPVLEFRKTVRKGDQKFESHRKLNNICDTQSVVCSLLLSINRER